LNRIGLIALGVLVVVLGVSQTLFSSSASATPGSGVLYGTDAGTAELYEINTTTGVGTLKGDMGIFSVPSLAGDPVTNTLYALSGGVDNNLYSVVPTGAVATLVGGGGLGVAGYGGSDFDNSGQLWASANVAGGSGTSGSGSDHLVKINKATGVATVIGPFGICTGVTIPAPSGPNGTCTIEGIEGIAFDSAGTLWGVENERGDFGTPGLYTINTTTGAATLAVAPIDDAAAGLHPSGGVVAIQFACDGTMFAGTARRQAGAIDGGMLGKINPTTGLFTFISAAPITSGSPANSLGGLAEIPSNCLFNVNKNFVPANAGSVTVSLSCTNGGVGTATDSSASMADDANFNVYGYTLGSDPTCTATETAVPAGYTTSSCSALLSVGVCTITNTQTSTTLAVSKVYSPGGPLTPVTVTVTCTSGTVVPNSGPAAPGSPFTTTLTGFNVSGTTCTATEAVPAGYTPSSTCVAVPISHGVPATCTITNVLIQTPNPSAVGGLVDIAVNSGGDSGGAGASVPWLALGLAVVMAFVFGGGTYSYVRNRS